MKIHPLLQNAKNILKKQDLHTSNIEENLIGVAIDNKSDFFAYLVVEKEQFPGIIISLALDFYNIHVVSDMVINLMYIAPIAKGDIFYRSNGGVLYWEDDAYEYFSLENNPHLLKDLNPITDSKH